MNYEEMPDPKKKKKATPNLLKDDRFKAMFENPDFQIDVHSQEYALLNPVISQMGKARQRAQAQAQAQAEVQENNTNEADDAGKTIFILL